MEEKQQLIEEIEGASENLVREVLNFLLFTKSKSKSTKFESSEESEDIQDRASTVKSQKSLKSLLLEIPEVGEDADFERKLDIGRDIDL